MSNSPNRILRGKGLYTNLIKMCMCVCCGCLRASTGKDGRFCRVFLDANGNGPSVFFLEFTGNPLGGRGAGEWQLYFSKGSGIVR